MKICSFTAKLKDNILFFLLSPCKKKMEPLFSKLNSFSFEDVLELGSVLKRWESTEIINATLS